EGLIVDRRKNDRLCPYHPKIGTTQCFRQNVLRLACPSVKPRQFSAVHNVRIKWVGDDIPVFFRSYRRPFAKSHLAIVPAAGDTSRTAFLLAAAQAVRESVVSADVIK